MGLRRQQYSFFSIWVLLLLLLGFASAVYDGPLYDFTAYTECKARPEHPLYNGGILQDQRAKLRHRSYNAASGSSPQIVLRNLTGNTYYCFSGWVRINEAGASDVLIKASLASENTTYDCIGTVIARSRCWSFLKGGFALTSPVNSSRITFQSNFKNNVTVSVASSSLQPFTEEEWRFNQQYIINKVRKRAVTLHVSDSQGRIIQGAKIKVHQTSKEFPFGSAIAKTIIGNEPYQEWFAKRFNTAVFENELKWYATEAVRGVVNYTVADQMMRFVRRNKIVTRGHNIFWDDPKYTPGWVLNLTAAELRAAVTSRMRSLMEKYRNEFIHWDVDNEMLHFHLYEERLGPNATLGFFEAVREADPLATLFMNDFNVVETCSDANSTVDAYIAKLKEFGRYGVPMAGVGLEGHFSAPNMPLIRAVIDKFATLNLPIWLTEVDIINSIDGQTQATYLDQVLREGYAHPAVNGMIMWTAIHPYGCYQMCLTDQNFKNLPTGEAVDKLIEEWQTGKIEGFTDDHGTYSFFGFLGEHGVTIEHANVTQSSTLALARAGPHEARHVYIVL
uniref:GH10 domain-containing protein n=1 Tax=Kalanchoe fedtschenkoi TaxID=63787 RepID=A0A7N0UWB9_KALFE